jgi:hypothetical protein
MAKTSDVTRARKAAAPVPIEIRLGEAEPETLRTILGSRSDRFNNAFIAAGMDTGWFPPGRPDEERSRQMFVAVTSLQAFAPADEIEGIICAQAVAVHHASMECSRRAMLADQPFEAAQELRKAAANASRTSCYRRWTASAAKVVSRLSASSTSMSTQEGRPLSEASKPAAEGEGVRTKCPRNPYARPTGAFTSSWRSRVPDAEHGRGAGDRVKVRRCQTAAAGCTEAAPGLRQRGGWHEFARRGRSMGGTRLRIARWPL